MARFLVVPVSRFGIEMPAGTLSLSAYSLDLDIYTLTVLLDVL